jgi:hypothetical protein
LLLIEIPLIEKAQEMSTAKATIARKQNVFNILNKSVKKNKEIKHLKYKFQSKFFFRFVKILRGSENVLKCNFFAQKSQNFLQNAIFAEGRVV